MSPLTDAEIRASLLNASKRERGDLHLPADFAELQWDRLDYLGWRDPKHPRRAYVIVPTVHGLAGVMLSQAEASPRSRAQCNWCQDVTLPNDVVFFAARRAGAAGRRGDSVGVLVCQDFQCSKNVRKLPPLAYEGFDREAARERRIAQLRERAEGFTLELSTEA